jgi:5-methylcytosine-specific restriction endonuclease McrA
VRKAAEKRRSVSTTKQGATPTVGSVSGLVKGKFLVDVTDFTPGECVNCGAAAVGNHLLFCGERCRQIGELVRYARRKIAEGTFDRPDVAEAIASRRSQLIFGFYDKRARKVPNDIRLQLLAKSSGICARCGRPFTPDGDARFTVQHSISESGVKLEAWCYRCNMAHSLSVLIELTPDEREFAAWFDLRVRFPTPVVACDDPDNWPVVYPGLMAAARAVMKAQTCSSPY